VTKPACVRGKRKFIPFVRRGEGEKTSIRGFEEKGSTSEISSVNEKMWSERVSMEKSLNYSYRRKGGGLLLFSKKAAAFGHNRIEGTGNKKSFSSS